MRHIHSKKWTVLFFTLLLQGVFLCETGIGQTPLTTIRVASGFSNPLYVTSPPNDFDRLFVVEQRGRIRIIKEGVILSTDFLNLSSKVSQSGNERGLLGLAFHPDYETNGFFYVNYTMSAGGATIVERYQVHPINPDLADPNSGSIILGPITQPFTNHNGGNIQFGLDKKLYVGMGDGGSGGDPDCNAQNPNTLLGKMLRINDDGSVPADNPFVNNVQVLDRIWALGLRNPWRFSFDRETGDLYIGDVGQNALEEIDFQPGSSPGGENYGWKVMEGTNCFSNTNCLPGTPPCNHPSLILPILEYNHSGGKCSITGGYVYRGCAIPDLRGKYFYGDFCSAQVWTFEYDGINIKNLKDRTTELDPPGAQSIDFITSFGEDADGELYIVDRGGEIFKIVPDAPAPYEDLGFAKPGSGGISPKLEICGSMGSQGQALLRMRNANPSSIAVLYGSLTSGALPLLGGTFVPGLPIPIVVNFTTDSKGMVSLSFVGGNGPFDLFLQFLVSDPGATQNVSFSNAIKAIFQP